jgi:hypothetical protein
MFEGARCATVIVCRRRVGVGTWLRRLSCSVEEEAEEDVGEPVLEAFGRPAGVSDEP